MTDRRLYHRVAEQIVDLIESGDYPPGSRLPGERELADRFGVSRVTVREAEIALQAQGRIRIKTGSGVYVLGVDGDDETGFPNISAFELTEARSLVESEAAALAAKHVNDETLKKLEALVEVMASSERDDQQGADADREFHRTISLAAGNHVLSYLVETLWKMRDELESVKAVYDSVCAEDSVAMGIEHREVLDALRARSPRAARAAMQLHFKRLLKSMLDVSEEQALEAARLEFQKSRRRYLG